MKICIVDDEQSCIDSLLSLLKEYCKNHRLPLLCDTFSNGTDFKKVYTPQRYDIVFLDIYIGDETGMDLAAHIREHSENAMIIFCTTSLSDMPTAFKYHAYEYIIKPPAYDRIEAVLDDAISVLPDLEQFIELDSGKQHFSLALSTLVSAQASGHYLDIAVTKGDPLSLRFPFADFKELATDERFLLINRGILVNMDHIDTIADRNCIMDNGDVLPIKVRESASIKSRWQDYCISKIRRGQK